MLTHNEQKKLKKYVSGIDVGRMAMAFDALGEPKRCLIFRALLAQNDVTVGQLARAVGISEPLASQHLKVLMQAALIERTKQGKNVYYTVNSKDPFVRALEEAVER